MEDLVRTPKGTSFSIFLMDGVPSGIRIVEEDNWSGIAVECARSDLKRAKGLDPFQRSGVYVLVGDEGGNPKVYVGEADVFSARLTNHSSSAAKKDFWNRAVIFTDSNGRINRAHGKYLESQLWKIASTVNTYDLDNSQPSLPPNLSVAEKDFVDGFLLHVLRILPLLGITAFELPSASESQSESPLFNLSSGTGAEATGRENSQGFIVYEGAIARKDEVSSISDWGSAARAALIESGALVEEANGYRLTQDRQFSSPTLAAVVLLGRPANGRTEWKDAAGTTLKEWQDTQAAS